MIDETTPYVAVVVNGIHQFHFRRIPSTHALAQRWPWQQIRDNDWVMLLADEQSGGRGQRDNAWSSPVGNLYMTLLFRVHDPHIVARCLLTQATALTVAQAIDTAVAAGDQPTIKWINDVFLRDKKVCGTLISADNVGSDFFYQVSVGVNLNVAPIDTSICLRDVTGLTVDVREFANTLAQQCRENMKLLFGADGDRERLRLAIDGRLQFKNAKVDIWDYDLKNIEHSGTFVGINAFGHARIQLHDGGVAEYFEGRMRLAVQ